MSAGPSAAVEVHDTIPADPVWTFERYRTLVLGVKSATEIVLTFDLSDEIEAGDFLCIAEDRAFLALGDDDATELPESWRAFHVEALRELADARDAGRP